MNLTMKVNYEIIQARLEDFPACPWTASGVMAKSKRRGSLFPSVVIKGIASALPRLFWKERCINEFWVTRENHAISASQSKPQTPFEDNVGFWRMPVEMRQCNSAYKFARNWNCLTSLPRQFARELQCMAWATEFSVCKYYAEKVNYSSELLVASRLALMLRSAESCCCSSRHFTESWSHFLFLRISGLVNDFIEDSFSPMCLSGVLLDVGLLQVVLYVGELVLSIQSDKRLANQTTRSTTHHLSLFHGKEGRSSL